MEPSKSEHKYPCPICCKEPHRCQHGYGQMCGNLTARVKALEAAVKQTAPTSGTASVPGGVVAPAKPKITTVGRVWRDGDYWYGKDWSFDARESPAWAKLLENRSWGPSVIHVSAYAYSFAELACIAVKENPRVGDSWKCEGSTRTLIYLDTEKFEISGGGGIRHSREKDGSLGLSKACSDFSPIADAPAAEKTGESK